MLQIILEEVVFGIVIEGVVLEVTVLVLADAIFRHGRSFVNGF